MVEARHQLLLAEVEQRLGGLDQHSEPCWGEVPDLTSPPAKGTEQAQTRQEGEATTASEAATAFLKAKCWSKETYDHHGLHKENDTSFTKACEVPLWRLRLQALVDGSKFNGLCFLVIA